MEVSVLANDLAEVMARQLRLRKGTFVDVTDRAGRKLPRHLRAEADIIANAELLSQNPKLAYRIDAKRVNKAEKRLKRFLEKQDPRAERMAAFLNWLAAIVFVIFCIALAFFFFALSRGYFD